MKKTLDSQILEVIVEVGRSAVERKRYGIPLVHEYEMLYFLRDGGRLIINQREESFVGWLAWKPIGPEAIQLVSMAVASGFQGCGIGSEMLADLRAETPGMLCSVRHYKEWNLSGFFAENGFSKVGLMPNEKIIQTRNHNVIEVA